MKHRYTTDEIEEIKRLTMGGYTQSHIADKVGVTKAGVAYYQKKFGLKASNKWHFGESASNDLNSYGEVYTQKETEELPIVEKKEVVPKKVEKKWTSIADQTLILTGINTGFSYTISTTNEIVKIEPTYGPAIEIESKDICAFGNELIDIAERLCKMVEEANK